MNEAAQKKLEDFRNQSDDEPVDEHGHSAEWFRDMGIPVPPSLLEKTTAFEDSLKLDSEKDYDWYEVDITINEAEIEMLEDDIEEGCMVHLKSGKYLEVVQDSADINAQIWYNNRNTWEKIKEWILIKKLKIIRKFKKKNGTNINN